MVQQTENTVTKVSSLTDAVRYLAVSVRSQRRERADVDLVMATVTFSLTDLPDYQDRAQQQRDLFATVQLQKEINLAIGAAVQSAFTFDSIEFNKRSVQVRGELVTIRLDVRFRRSRRR